MGFKKYFFSFIVPMMFIHDIFYESVVPILEQTTIYLQSTYT